MPVATIKMVIIFVVALFVVTPFFFKKEEEEYARDCEKSKAYDLISQKDIVLGEIIDLEYDYKMQKLSKKDYKALKIQLKNEAAHLYKEIDKLNADKAEQKKA